MRTLNAAAMSQAKHALLPIGPREIDRSGNVSIPAATYHQKSRLGRTYHLEGGRELLRQNNVAVDIADEVVSSEPLCAVKDRVEPLRSAGIDNDICVMADTELGADCRSALVITKQDDIDVRMKQLPALQCVALDDGGVAAKCLCSSK